MLHFSVWFFFVWLNSSVLFTWEINLRPYDGHYPPTDTWANTPILYEHEPAGAHARRQTREHMFASMQYKHTQGACARSTYLHTLIENRQTYSPTCHLNTVHAYFFLAWIVQSDARVSYARYLIFLVIINDTFARTVKSPSFICLISQKAQRCTSRLMSEQVCLWIPNQAFVSHIMVGAPIRYWEIYPKTQTLIMVLFIKYYSCQKGAACGRAFHSRWNTSLKKETEIREETILIFWSKCPRFQQMTFCTTSIL